MAGKKLASKTQLVDGGHSHIVKFAGKSYDVNDPAQHAAGKAHLQQVYDSHVSPSGHPMDTAAGKHEMSVLQYEMNGQPHDQAVKLADARNFQDGAPKPSFPWFRKVPASNITQPVPAT